MKERISAIYGLGLALLAAAPVALASSPSTLTIGIDPSSVLLLCSGLVGVIAIRRLER